MYLAELHQKPNAPAETEIIGSTTEVAGSAGSFSVTIVLPWWRGRANPVKRGLVTYIN